MNEQVLVKTIQRLTQEVAEAVANKAIISSELEVVKEENEKLKQELEKLKKGSE